jgi:hypothetical protein
MPTQSLPAVYVQNASLEMAWTYVVTSFGTISGKKIAPFFTEGYEGFDINDEDDFATAARLVAEGRVTLPHYQHARLISRLRRSTKPILVGPFRGEVGFEVLYWIPWLRYLRETLKIAPERIIPIGRAGSACWYGCPTGVELYSLRTPQELRVVNRINQQKYGMLKQIYYDAFDQAIVEEVARR